jgi:hypothetical protein
MLRTAPSRVARWRARLAEWMVRSSRAFLLGLVIACGIQVLLDWNATLVEINVLRNAIRQKGENYVGILGKASDDELGARDRAGLDRLSHGIFDDEDAVYVRFTDAAGAVVWDKLKPEFADAFAHRNAESFVEQFGKLMDRDTQRALHDPEGLKAHVANSRYKDFAQAWTDATARVLASVTAPPPPGPNRGVIVYEDRLHDENRRKDDRISYAIGTVLGEDGKDIGTVIVAFDMTRTNEAVRFKYIKFAGLCSFFVALILVQNTVSRRTKIRLLDLNARNAAAKGALREAMPAKDVAVAGGLSACGAIDQARGPVDGMMWTAADEGGSLLVLVIDPDGDGVDAAAVGLHVVRTFRSRRHDAPGPHLDDELRAIGDAATGIPLTRPLGVVLLRVDARTGAYEALCGDFAQLRVVGRDAVEIPPPSPEGAVVPEGVLGPVTRVSGVLERGQSVVAVCADASKVDATGFADGVARYIARTHEAGVVVPVQDAAIWARGKTATLADSDIAVVAVSRASA